MATITNTTSSPYTNPVTSSPSSASSGNSSALANSATDPLANESTFLTLLVSQLKNQNPTSPMDGTTFVTQLAQFSDLEQNLAMRNDLDALKTKYAADPATANQNAATASSQGVSS